MLDREQRLDKKRIFKFLGAADEVISQMKPSRERIQIGKNSSDIKREIRKGDIELYRLYDLLYKLILSLPKPKAKRYQQEPVVFAKALKRLELTLNRWGKLRTDRHLYDTQSTDFLKAELEDIYLSIEVSIEDWLEGVFIPAITEIQRGLDSHQTAEQHFLFGVLKFVDMLKRSLDVRLESNEPLLSDPMDLVRRFKGQVILLFLRSNDVHKVTLEQIQLFFNDKRIVELDTKAFILRSLIESRTNSETGSLSSEN